MWLFVIDVFESETNVFPIWTLVRRSSTITTIPAILTSTKMPNASIFDSFGLDGGRNGIEIDEVKSTE